MSVALKAIYYPELTLIVGETRFGSKKLLEPKNPYVCALNNKKVLVRIDMLVCLKSTWGVSILLARDNIYKLVSGDTTDDKYRQLLSSYYRTHAAFANHVDMLAMFGRQDIPFIKRFTEDVRSKLSAYGTLVSDTVRKSNGVKFLLEDREYRYYAVPESCDLSSLEGVVYIR